MTEFTLNDVRAMRWDRDPGRSPKIDNAHAIIEFIGPDRVLAEEYRADLGDEVIMFTTNASRIGIDKIHPTDWVVFGPRGEPMAISGHVFQELIEGESGD